MNYKILIDNHDYNNWNFIDPITGNPIKDNDLLNSIKPIEHKMFTRDYFTILDNNVKIVESYYRQVTIPGILILQGNKTYGRHGKKLLYKCIPDDVRLPHFLIPYEIKMDFNKNFKNRYVIFNYKEWNNKHPIGVLNNNIGEIDSLENFYEYQLYCHNINISLAGFNKHAKEVIAQNENIIMNVSKRIDAVNHTDKRIITVDPKNSCDYDDALYIEENGENKHVYVYITNVAPIIDYLDLWDSFTNRVSTIYLPDRRRPLLPTLLTDGICSLQERSKRIALCFEFVFNIDNKQVGELKIYNALIQVHKNYDYEDSRINKNIVYTQLLNFTQTISKDVINSTDVVSHWMVKVNKEVGKHLLENKNGIYRSVSFTNNKEVTMNQENISQNACRLIRNWKNVVGSYVSYEEGNKYVHEMMDGDCYVHVTSPIRRLVDLLNHIDILTNIGIHLSSKSFVFKKQWLDKIEYINTSMRSIRKVQSDCELLTRCVNEPSLFDNEFKCVLFDKLQKTDKSYSFMVYIEDLNILSKYITFDNLNENQYYSFKLFLFQDEYKLKKKIKLKYIS